MPPSINEAASETVIDPRLLANGYVCIPESVFDSARAIFPEAILNFMCKAQENRWRQLNSMRAGTGRMLELLKDGRTAFIAAAVTGKIAVPTRPASAKKEHLHEN